MTTSIYIAKLVVFYICGGVLVATLTSGLDPLHPAAWWTEPIVYQKLVLWTVLLECLGLAGSWGPLAGHFKPMTGGVPLLGAAGHDPAAAVAGAGAVHRAVTSAPASTSCSTWRCSPRIVVALVAARRGPTVTDALGATTRAW